MGPGAAAAGDAGDGGRRRPPGPGPPGGGQQGPGGDSYAWYRRGLDLLSRGSPAAAAELLERAAAAEPGARSIREALARAQFDAGRYAQAADNFRQNVEAIPSDDYAHFGLGLALARGGIQPPPRSTSRWPLPCARNWRTTPRRCVVSGRRWRPGRQARSGASPAPGPDGDEPSDQLAGPMAGEPSPRARRRSRGTARPPVATCRPQ